jgi:hypothetical protein
MLAFHVDFNAVDTSPTGGLAVGITLGHSNPPALRSLMEVGMRVIVYGDDIREEAILQRGNWSSGWVAVLIEGTLRDLAPGEYERLLTASSQMSLDQA